jgi:hypothetical protein
VDGIILAESHRFIMNIRNREKHMTDTIELLETIGRDASLRHASAEELTKVLTQANASEALAAAVASGDAMQLSKELGHKHMDPPQFTQIPGHEEEPEQEEGENAPPAPHQDK